MATTEQMEALRDLAGAAVTSGHIWPAYAACEAVLETSWGTSELYRSGNNVFGAKQADPPRYLTKTFATREFLKGQWVMVEAKFVWYPSPIHAFMDRMDLLQRLAGTYQEYADALAAKSGEEFVLHVSRRWSTDPQRGQKVMQIFDAHSDMLLARTARTTAVANA